MVITKKKNAFTLIELLVVISIIAILMAIMMPALGKAKEQALTIVCASQHKDIGLALNLYTQDWKGALPRAYWKSGSGMPYSRLPVKLSPYYDTKIVTSDDAWDFKLFSCPGQPKVLWNADKNQAIERGKGAVGTYGYNMFFLKGIAPSRADLNKLEKYLERKASDIKDGANMPLLGCVSGEKYNDLAGGGGQVLNYQGPHPKAFKYGYMGGRSPGSLQNTNNSGPAPNHSKNCNMLMGDFSARAVNVCEDGKFPWQDHVGTAFHPSRASKDGDLIR